jgi:hypothetical protein
MLEGDALIAAHKAVQRRLRILGIVFPLVVIAIVGGYLYAIVNQVKNADTEAIAAASAEKLGRIWPEVEQHLGDVAKAVEPALGDAVEREGAAMVPIIEQRLTTDVERMVATTEESFAESVEQAIMLLDAQQRATLVAELPELADIAAQERVLGSARLTLAEWAHERFHTALEDHVAAIGSIRKTLTKSYTKPEDKPVEPTDALVLWLELMNEQIGGSDVLALVDERQSAKAPQRKK